MTFREQWNALMGKMGISSDGATSAAESRPETRPREETTDESPDREEKSAGPERERIDPETVRATRTLPCEDPSPTEPVLSANATAYSEDARNFR